MIIREKHRSSNHVILKDYCSVESEFGYSDIDKYARAILDDEKREHEEIR